MVSSFRSLKVASNPGPSGVAHLIPTRTFPPGTKYPRRTDVNFCPSREHSVMESFFCTTRHQISAVSDRSGIVDQSEKSRIKTTLAWRRPSKNSVPHFIQIFSVEPNH